MKKYTYQTNISSIKTANILLKLLPYYYKIAQIQFDLNKGKGIFTIQVKDIQPDKIQTTIKDFGYRCQLIEK